MKKRDFMKISQRTLAVLMCMAAVFFTGCEGSTTVEAPVMPDAPYDPSQPVVLNSFDPKEGSVGTQILIKGSNFGTDPQLIKVTLDDVPLNVVSSSGTIIYASIPQKQPTNLSAPLSIKIGNQDNVQEVVTKEDFQYVISPFVSTLAGFYNPRDQSSDVKDGEVMLPSDPDFDADKGAQFHEPMWISFDQHKNLYILEEHKAIRFIDKDHQYVKTKKLSGNGYGRFRTIAFSNDWKTMYVTNDGSNWETSLGTAVFKEENNFEEWERIINSKQCNGGAVHPVDDIYFFNSYEEGQVFKWNGPSNELQAKKNSKELFKIQDSSWEFNIQFHPSGDFAYIVVINHHYILKSYYNWETKELQLPTLFAGYPTDESRGSHLDGVATAARFNFPYQGTFDEDDNFYICDKNNHCIRKITPDGIVSTFAGRIGFSGTTDGALRDAQFNCPSGIVYDKEEKVFYIADRENKRIRMITMPK